MSNLHDFSAIDIHGKPCAFSQWKGKKVLVVNTASECGYTPQYAGLQELYEQFKDKGLIVVGFPSNDFGAQEPGTNGEIAEFCDRQFGVSFPLMQKTPVLGPDAHPLYKWIADGESNGWEDVEITWNFQKILFDENGDLVATVPPGADPMGKEIMQWLTQTTLF